MATIVESAIIADVWTVEPVGHGDERGRFYETYRRSWFPLGREMVQGNRSDKAAGAVVGLHYHLHQADYWLCPRGRPESCCTIFGWGRRRRGRRRPSTSPRDNGLGVFIPPGVAHGFASLSDLTLTYLVDSYYNPEDELGVAWDDPEVAADWGIKDPILSARDQSNPRRADIDPSRRPHRALRT